MIQRFYNTNKVVGFKHQHGILDENSALILASVEREKLGVVIDASSSVQNVFKLSKKMVIGSKINSLMPAFIARNHDSYLYHYNQNTGTKPIQRTIHTFAKTYDDFILYIYLSLSL